MYRKPNIVRDRRVEDTIKITARTPERVDEIIDKIIEIYRCVVSPIRNGNNGTFFTYLTIIAEVSEE